MTPLPLPPEPISNDIPTSILKDPPPKIVEGTGRAGGTIKTIELSENQQIGRFDLIREIARGGMGQVFLARDTQLGRKVAIKFLLRSDPTFLSRFLVEARATARCTHENIVTIYEVGEHEGLPFMVLEYLEGKTLGQVLDAQPTLQQFTEIAISIVRALERAHEHGIVHRDLKPSNIFITDRGVVKVLDFGVARLMDDAPSAAIEKVLAAAATQDHKKPTKENTYVTFSGGGTMVGTVPYMSPEQWGAGEVDHQSDLWAIGIMFWRALTKVHPGGSLSADKLREKLCDLETPLPSIANRDATIPAELVKIIDRCLMKKKAERYPSATELLADLQEFVRPKGDQFDENNSPYRGLSAFGEHDAKYFFGRSAEVRTAVEQLDVWPLLAVIGPSGVGKSSFVHAGLVPAIRRTGVSWQVRILRPGRMPMHSLAATVDGKLAEGYQAVEMAAHEIKDAPGLYGDMLRKAARLKKHKVLIVVDQLEELFTLSSDDEVRSGFLAALLAAADDPSAPVRVVLSMRADFLDRLASHRHFLDELSRGLFFLSAPDRENLRETIVRPAELAGYQYENDDIVDEMLAAATTSGALPLLQFAAQRMWDTRDRGKKKLTRSAYAAMGGVGGAFAQHADEVAAQIPPQDQLLLKAIMTQLVTPEGTRAVVDQKALLELTDDRAGAERILDQLIRGRLVNRAVDPMQGIATVEIVHEVLIAEWPMLKRWLEDGHALRGFLHELRSSVRQWVARNRPDDLVWSGGIADEALAIMKRNVLDLSSAEREFMDRVRVLAAKAKKKRVMVLTSVIGALSVVILAGAIAVVTIMKARTEANEQAETAQKEATRARAAEAEAARQLAAVKSEEAKRTAAEGERAKAQTAAAMANEAVKLSREELEKANVDLKTALEQSKADQVKAQELAVKAQELAAAAKVAADKERKASEDAKTANAKLQQLLAAEQARYKKLEAEKGKIATGLQ